MSNITPESAKWDKTDVLDEYASPIYAYALQDGSMVTATREKTTFYQTDGTSVSVATPQSMEPLERGEG